MVARNFTPAGVGATSCDESATSPLVGIVVKAMANVSVYGNFTSGLTRGAMAPATSANAGEVFAPYKSKQYEAGVKLEQGKLLGGISVFQIDRPNAVTDPVTTIYSMDGKRRNRGLELSVMGEVVRNLRLMASATPAVVAPARYRRPLPHSVMGQPVILRASVENVADKAYWLANGTFATAAAARTALVSAQFDF